MIPVTPAPEPPGFDAAVRQLGKRALHRRIGREPPTAGTGDGCHQAKRSDGTLIERFEDLGPKHFPDYWIAALDDLYHAYHQICAYCCFRIHPVTGSRSADHLKPKSIPGEGNADDIPPEMVPMSNLWDHVYEWSNYRLSSGRLNARKNDYQDVIDPFEVGADWFEMEFVAFQLRPPEHLSAPIRERVQATIERLGLNDDNMCQARENDYTDYREGHISLTRLQRESPLVARETTRTGRIHPTDAPPPVDESSNAPG